MLRFVIVNQNDDNWIDIKVQLRMIFLKFGLLFSPIVFNVSDLYDDNPFINEIIGAGGEIK
jgi:hypothetical protein